MRRLALVLVVGLLLATTLLPSAEATLRVCGLPVDARCYDWENREWCFVYVRVPGEPGGCVEGLLET